MEIGHKEFGITWNRKNCLKSFEIKTEQEELKDEERLEMETSK